MSYVGIDARAARALGSVLQDTAGRVEAMRRSVSVALDRAYLASQAPMQLALVQDSFARLAAGVTDKATLAERRVVEPQAIAANRDVPSGRLAATISGLLGFAAQGGPRSGGALPRLQPGPPRAFQAGRRPEPAEDRADDLNLPAFGHSARMPGQAMPLGVSAEPSLLQTDITTSALGPTATTLAPVSRGVFDDSALVAQANAFVTLADGGANFGTAGGDSVLPTVTTASGSPFAGLMSLGVHRGEDAEPEQLRPTPTLFVSGQGTPESDIVTVADGGALAPGGGVASPLTTPVTTGSELQSPSTLSSVFSSILQGVLNLPSLFVSSAEAATPRHDAPIPPIGPDIPVLRIPIRIAVGGDSLTAYTGIRDGRSSYTVTLPGGYTIEVPDTAFRSDRSPIAVAVEMLRQKYPQYDIQLVNVSESGTTPAGMLTSGSYFWEQYRPPQADAFIGPDIAIFGVGANPFAYLMASSMMYPYPLGYLNLPWSTGYTPQDVFRVVHDQLMASSNRADLGRLYDVAIPGVVTGGAVVAFGYPLMFTPGNDEFPVPSGGSEWLNAFTLSVNGLMREANDDARTRWAPYTSTSVHYFGLEHSLAGMTYGMSPSGVNFGTRDGVGFFHPNGYAVPPLARDLFRQLEPVFLDQVNRRIDEFLGIPPSTVPRPFIAPGTRADAEPQVFGLVTDANGDVRYELSGAGQSGFVQLTSASEPSGGVPDGELSVPSGITVATSSAVGGFDSYVDTNWASGVDLTSFTTPSWVPENLASLTTFTGWSAESTSGFSAGQTEGPPLFDTAFLPGAFGSETDWSGVDSYTYT